jgi:hypothetical protein
MFKCKKCGISNPGDKQHKVISQIRKVTYILQTQYYQRGSKTEDNLEIPTMELKTKILRETHGTEIVKEDIYCHNCIPKNLEPKITNSINRKQIIKAKSRNSIKRKSNRSEKYGQKEKADR